MVSVINAEGAVLGRLCSSVAKQLLEGESVVVVNAGGAVITGERKVTEEKYFEKRKRGDRFKGPFIPRYPDQLLRRTVRGMLPYKVQRGREALARLRVFSDLPEELKGKEKSFGKSVSDLRCKFLTLNNVCKSLGAKL